MTDWRETLKTADVSLHVIATGAGAGIQQTLWEMPGASKYLSGCSFPYAAEETAELLGFEPEKYVLRETAIDLASAAYMRAYRFGGKSPVGLGVTAAMPTDRSRRGRDHAFMCVITDSGVRTEEFLFPGVDRARSGAACDHYAIAFLRSTSPGYTDATEAALTRFMERPVFDELGRRSRVPPAGRHFALLPGAFNPPTAAHFAIAAEVEAKHGLPVVFQVSGTTPHKPPLTVQERLRCARLLRGHRVLFTEGAPLYLDKARAFPETPLVLGTDALLRMFDPKWGPEVTAMLYEFSELGTRFYVAPRIVGGERLSLDDVFRRSALTDCELQALFTELETSLPDSSTALRTATG